MLRFSCDYHEGAHPKIMERLMATNMEQSVGYGEDDYCRRAAERIRALCGDERAAVHFLVGGTQTNTTVIAAALRPHQGVLTAVSGHINNHESGAIEACGHKVIGLPTEDGKITARQVHDYYEWHRTNESYEHIVQPKMVYISNPTEYGSIYTRAELEALSRVCRKDGLLLFLDGARLGYGLAAEDNDLDLPFIYRCCDVFYIGGTKCGALFGEAVVIRSEALKEDFRFILKQKGGMLAKGRLLGIQFETLFTDNLYFDISAHAIKQAMRIRKAFSDRGVHFLVDNKTNQQFPILEDSIIKRLSANFDFSYEKRIDENHSAIRFCTSWATPEASVDALIDAIMQVC